MALTAKTTHVEEGLAQLAQQFHGKAKLEALLTAVLQQVQDLEDALHTITAGNVLDDAVGDQLDGLGSIVGEERNGRTDDVYRLWIRSRLLLNRSSGLTEEIIAIVSLLVADGATVEVTDDYPAAFTTEVLDVAVPNADATEIVQIHREAKAAGVDALFGWSPGAPEDTFTTPLLVGVLATPLTGGIAEVTLDVTMLSGEFPATGTNLAIKIGSGPLAETFSSYISYTPGAPGNLSIDGVGEIANAHDAGEYIFFAGSETVDPGLGFDDIGSPGGGGQLAGLAR